MSVIVTLGYKVYCLMSWSAQKAKLPTTACTPYCSKTSGRNCNRTDCPCSYKHFI